jgi:hypothetical protein
MRSIPGNCCAATVCSIMLTSNCGLFRVLLLAHGSRQCRRYGLLLTGSMPAWCVPMIVSGYELCLPVTHLQNSTYYRLCKPFLAFIDHGKLFTFSVAVMRPRALMCGIGSVSHSCRQPTLQQGHKRDCLGKRYRATMACHYKARSLLGWRARQRIYTVRLIR